MMPKNNLTTIRLATIKPAEYNPRKLSEDAYERLKESLTKLGVIKAIIVNSDNNVIVAGHQRTKTMISLGIEECPAFLISGVKAQDEIRFNQFHNRCEYEYSENQPKVFVKGTIKEGWNIIPNSDIIIKYSGRKAEENLILTKLLLKYGEFGNSICSMEGEILVSGGYALASKLCGLDLYVYAVNKEKEALCKYYFSRDYGTYSYSNIKRETYVQGLAQISRIPAGGKMKKSSLYEKRIIPLLPTLKNKSILDFGAGKYDYAKLLQQQGCDIDYIDPYHCVNTGTIDVDNNKERFKQICSNLKRRGLYDIVICDSVLNSVDTLEARTNVILSCYGLCKDGGKIFISGRMVPPKAKEKCGLRKDPHCTMYFPDDEGFTATMRDKHWFFQKFDNEEQIKKIGCFLGDAVVKKADSSWHIIATKRGGSATQEEIIKALRSEWDMPLPQGSYGLSDEIEKSYRYAISHH